MMKRQIFMILLIATMVMAGENLFSQCSICTRTAQQMGERPARGLNSGIVYLMLTPFAVAGYVSYRWWKSNRD